MDEDNDQDYGEDPSSWAVPQKIVQFMGFSAPGSKACKDQRTDAFLHYPKGHDPGSRLALYDHPIATRSAVTFPTFSRISFSDFYFPESEVTGHRRYPRPIAVWDWHNKLRSRYAEARDDRSVFFLLSPVFPE